MTAQAVALPHFKDQYNRLALLVEGITVDSVAEFNLETCLADEPAAKVLERMDAKKIDQMPVDPERAFYVVRGSLVAGKHVRDAVLQPFATPGLIAAGTPFSKAYPLFQARSFLFLLRGTKIQGIVTRGDFQRAPFRMYLFGLLSLLEMGITRLVLETYGDYDWQRLPGTGDAVENGKRWYKTAKKYGEEPHTVFEVVNLEYKLDVFGVAGRAHQALDKEDRDRICSLDRDEVKTLRDNLAHAKDLTQDLNGRWQQVFTLAEALEEASKAVTKDINSQRRA